ncbi:MAG: polyprenyl synthetase family protein, partial [Rhodoblastus sp.]|nr:polyprenyl synthetase family protein [Rhodoblastus sp.]
MGVVIPLEEKTKPEAKGGVERLVSLVSADMERVNQTILARTGSDVTMIPEVANHLISSGGKRLRPMLTLATAALCDYRG